MKIPRDQRGFTLIELVVIIVILGILAIVAIPKFVDISAEANTAALQGVVSQLLLPKADGTGRILSTEIMVATAGIRNLIREQAIEQIPTAIQTGSAFGMHTMDKSLQHLYQQGVITYDTAIDHVKNREEFKQLLNTSAQKTSKGK